MLSLIAAATTDGAIGFKGGLPWSRNRADMAAFKDITMKVTDPTKVNALIMGRATFESLPNGRPLPGRVNIVLSKKTSQRCQAENNTKRLVFVESPQAALAYVRDTAYIENTFVIGGAQVYRACICAVGKYVSARNAGDFMRVRSSQTSPSHCALLCPRGVDMNISWKQVVHEIKTQQINANNLVESGLCGSMILSMCLLLNGLS